MISEEIKNKIWELRQQGNSVLQISIQLKIGKASASEWCKRFDPEKKYDHSHKNKFNTDIPLIIEEYLINKSLQNMTELERQEIKNAWVSVEVEKQFEYVLFLEIMSIFLIILLILILSNLKQKKLQKKIQILNDNLEESIKIEVQKKNVFNTTRFPGGPPP